MSGSRQQHAQLPARRHRAHRPRVLLDRHAQPQQQLARAGLGGVAAVLRVLRFQFRGVQELLLARLRIRVDGVALAHRRPHLGVALQHHVQHALVFERELVLPQPPHPLVGIDRHRARGGLQLAAQDLHEGGLAAAVGADQPVAVAAAELDGDL